MMTGAVTAPVGGGNFRTFQQERSADITRGRAQPTSARPRNKGKRNRIPRRDAETQRGTAALSASPRLRVRPGSALVVGQLVDQVVEGLRRVVGHVVVLLLDVEHRLERGAVDHLLRTALAVHGLDGE